MLIEHSFHTNTKATKWLSKDANLDKLAVAEADILAEFFGMESSTETEKTAIMGKAQATAQQMALFCRSKNSTPQLTSCSLEQLAEMFIEEGEAEGVRGDVAFAQSLHETGYFIEGHSSITGEPAKVKLTDYGFEFFGDITEIARIRNARCCYIGTVNTSKEG